MATATLFLLLLFCMLLGMPIAIALGLSSIATIMAFSSDSLVSIALKMFEATSEHYTLHSTGHSFFHSVIGFSFYRWCRTTID